MTRHEMLAAIGGAALLALGLAGPASAAGTGYIFVSNEADHTVTVVDGKTFQVVKTIATGQRPRDMRWVEGKTRLLVAVSGSDRIDVIDVSKLEVVGAIQAGEDPEIFALDPSGKILVAANEDDNEVTVTDAATGERIRTVEGVGVEPEGVTFRHDGKVVFVTSEATNTVFVIDPWQGEIITEVLVGNRPRRGIVTPDDKEYWVTNELGATVTILDAQTYELIDTVHFEKRGLRQEDISPVDFAMTRDGKTAYITLGRANHVAVVDVASREVTDYILAGKRVWGAALNADESLLVVTNGASDDITIIDTAKKVAVNSVAVGRTPHTVRIDD
ncbi:MAG TPA: PQQ-dependent catabolism-associated beta-propeller protein [Alphaproteobacteria bacterium]